MSIAAAPTGIAQVITKHHAAHWQPAAQVVPHNPEVKLMIEQT
ncbi:MAG TPA: hypothetical protein VHU84_04085 [Lacipirellulaceae bacterium]|nr:hypothetical protein [Lacipirellulaceae bacterium]